MDQPQLNTEHKKNTKVAYFSMEMMLESDIPTYAGGLGVLAGDLLRSCADMEIPVVGVSLVYSGNTFSQIINPDGSQSFAETDWEKIDQLTKIDEKIGIVIQDRIVYVGCWRYDIVGQSGFVVPVYLLDTDFPDNDQAAKDITKNLYGGDGEIRFSQEMLLGIGGVKMLRTLGYTDIEVFHLNEGHCAMVPLALLEENNWEDEKVRKLCTFTTHTPVPEGHDRFGYDQAYKLGSKYLPWHIKKIATEDSLSMTHLALNMSRYSFGVSKKHQKVSQNLFPGYNIDSITNGVYHMNWTYPTIQDLLNKHLPTWANDPKSLKLAMEKIPDEALWNAHQECKKHLIDYVNHHLTSVATAEERLHPHPEDLFNTDTLTISLARRPVAYKRPLLLYHDLEKFLRIGIGKIQIIQCGKSHPSDMTSQGFVQEIINISKKFRTTIKVCYLENYSPKIARLLVSGADIWLNTPRRPLEASGTSGMKAALNGVLNFSVLDGWWIEGFEMDPLSGFSIGPNDESTTPSNDDTTDAEDLYKKLEKVIIPMYYENRPEWVLRMKHAISLGAYFNTHRVVQEYIEKAWQIKH